MRDRSLSEVYSIQTQLDLSSLSKNYSGTPDNSFEDFVEGFDEALTDGGLVVFKLRNKLGEEGATGSNVTTIRFSHMSGDAE